MQLEQILHSIKKISTQITNSIHLEETAKKIVDEMAEVLSTVGGAILLVDEKTKTVAGYQYSSSVAGAYLTKVLKIDFRQLRVDFSKPVNLIGKAVKTKRIITGPDINAFTYPALSKTLGMALQRAGGITKIMAVPVIMQEKVLGLIILAFSKTEDEISEEKRFIIEIFADQVAIAINNALKYEELKKRYELEKETTALLSHELKTPIAITNNSAQILKVLIQELPGKHDAKLVEKFEKNQKEIHDGLLRMNSICSSIFNFREIENSVPTGNQNIDLKRLLDQMIRLYQTRAERKGLKFKSILRISKNEEFMGKAIQFEQVVSTILDNAVKYTEHGTIQLKISISPKTLKAEISDTGPGIPEQEREAIFERFNRLSQGDKTVQGLGLGLYMAKKITDELKGKIQITENDKAKSGTRFIIKIPR